MSRWLCLVHGILVLAPLPSCHWWVWRFCTFIMLSPDSLFNAKNWNLIKTNWLSWEWQRRQEWWVCRREGSTIHGTAVMSWNSPSVGVAGKCWARKAKVSPTGLVWGERSAESSSKATDKDGGGITITRNYRVNTVGRGALLPGCIGSALHCDCNCSSPACAEPLTALLKLAKANLLQFSSGF